MNQIATNNARIEEFRKRSLVAGIVGMVLLAVGIGLGLAGDEALLDQFYRSYLFGYVFWLGLPLGALSILLLHNMVGGPWGYVTRRVLQAAVKTLPLMVLLFIPVVLGMHSLYEWTHEAVVASDPILRHKAPWLNQGAFIIRAAIYFVLFIGFGWSIVRTMQKLEDLGGSVVTRRLQSISAVGTVVVFLAGTFAAFDWMMSLEPHWFSTAYGMIYMIGGTLMAFAFLIIMMWRLGSVDSGVDEALRPGYMHDLGNFMFAFMLLWAYVAVSQFIIIWSGNLPEETPWYLRRAAGAWKYFPIVLAIFHFAAPFGLLLSRKVKRDRGTLARVAMLIVVMHAIDLFWWIAPAFSHGGEVGFHISWLDLAAPFGIGGIWLAVFARILGRGTLLPLNVAYPKQEVEHQHV